MGSCTSAARNYHDEIFEGSDTYQVTKSTTSVTSRAHDDDNMVSIKIKMIKAEPFHINISSDSSVDKLKHELYKITHIEPQLQRLICCGGGILKSDKNIKDYSIVNGDIICLCIIPQSALYKASVSNAHIAHYQLEHVHKSQWISIGSLPKHSKSSFICMLNNNTDIISVCGDGIYKYDIHNNQISNTWNVYKKFPTQLSINSVSLDTDSKANDLYINILDNFMHSKFYKCEQNNDNKVDMIAMNIARDLYDIHRCNDEFIENSIIINGEYHIFALDENGKNLQHLILNTETNTFYKLHDFQTALGNFDLIYSPKQQRLFLVGGLIPFCIGQDFLTDIYSLSLSQDDKQWRKLSRVQLPVALADPVCVLTNNEQYIIILGGSIEDNGADCEWMEALECSTSSYCKDHSMSSTYNDIEYKDVDSIYVLNLHTMNITESRLKCPKAGMFNAVIPRESGTQKQCLVTGFVQNVYDEYVSSDVLNIIKSFYSLEYIHLFDRNGIDKMHWKISVDAILNSVV